MVLPLRFRVILGISVLMIIAAIALIRLNSKQKKDYDHLTDKITYINQRMGDLPFHDAGKYRYIRLENYIYPFEIYADEQGPRIDSLKKGDMVTAYFYENNFTRRDHINRFLQYLEKDGKLYYKSGNAVIISGYFIIVMAVLLSIFCYVFYKRGKIPY